MFFKENNSTGFPGTNANTNQLSGIDYWIDDCNSLTSRKPAFMS